MFLTVKKKLRTSTCSWKTFALWFLYSWKKKLGLNLAVLSMDIGIDAAGKLWIIEVNSKPASFDENDIRQRHLQLLMDYFSFVAQKNKTKD